MPIAPDRAPGVLIEPGLLVSLRRHQQEVHLVPVAVLPEELDDRQELLAPFLGRGALRVRGVDEVLPLDLVAEGRSQPVLPHERVQGREQLRAVLADGDGERAAGAHGDVLVDGEVRKDLLPEVGEIVVDHDGRDQAGVHHLEQVVVLEVRRRLADHHRRLPLGLELLVEREQALVVAAELAGEDFLARQVLDGGDRRRAGTGDQDLADVLPGGIAEVDVLLAARASP